jgi:flagellar protein FlaJ
MFKDISKRIADFFPALRSDLKKIDLKMSLEEYFALAIFTSFLIFLILLPIFSLVFTLLLPLYVFTYLSSFLIALGAAVLSFLFFIFLPTQIKKSKAKKIEDELPFATLYLSSISSSNLSLPQTLEIYEKASIHENVKKEVRNIIRNLKYFGMDILTALEKSIEKTPSKKMEELLWGILTTLRAGGNLTSYLKEKSKELFNEYLRKIYEFAQSLTFYIEIYLISVVLGVLFFIILTSIFAGIAGAAYNLVEIQFLLAFIFLPMIALIFMLLIRASSPGGEY